MRIDQRIWFALVAGVAAAIMAAVPARPQSVDNGRTIVTANCSGCHAVGALGSSPNPLSPPFRELHLRYPVENLAEALAEGIITGHPQMPQFRFSPREVSDIIAYLQSIQTNQHAEAPAAKRPRS